MILSLAFEPAEIGDLDVVAAVGVERRGREFALKTTAWLAALRAVNSEAGLAAATMASFGAAGR